MNVVNITTSISQRGLLSQFPSVKPFRSPDTMAAVYDPRCLRHVDNSLHVAPIMLQGWIRVNDVHEATRPYMSVVVPPHLLHSSISPLISP